MKRIFIISMLTFNLQLLTFNLFSQSIGIGTTTPVFKLDVRNGSINTDSVYRIGGLTVLSVKGTNTFVGVHSGFINTIGNFNTANGLNTLYLNTSGSYNTANGYAALYSNTTGTSNTANGYVALYSNTTGHSNTANGVQALFSNTTGNSNTANGVQALFSNNTGGYNTANGSYALLLNRGSYNTAHGYESLYNTTASDGNTALGYAAGKRFDNGYYNTYIGSDADANGAGYYNSIAIGNISTVTAPLQVRIGSSLMTSIGGYQNWSNLSDGRYKKNVKEDVKGLDFILKLRPVTYNLDVSELSKRLNESRGGEMNQLEKNAIAAKERVVCTGFIAQDVEKAAQETGYDFSGVDKPKNSNDHYGLRYAEFVVPLVKAVQEQQALIEKQNKIIEELMRRLELLEKRQ